MRSRTRHPLLHTASEYKYISETAATFRYGNATIVIVIHYYYFQFETVFINHLQLRLKRFMGFWGFGVLGFWALSGLNWA